MKTSQLDGWQWRHVLRKDGPQPPVCLPVGWSPATVPGTIHEELQRLHLIPDPFVALNKDVVRWIEDEDWEYQCHFNARHTARDTVALSFAGLDTFARISLNGQVILETENMFQGYRIVVTSHLKAKDNELTIRFTSAWLRGKKLEQEHGRRLCWNGSPSRLYVRKAQYHYGWDWGPKLMCAGPYRSVCLEVYQARIAELKVMIDVQDLGKVRVLVEAQVEGGSEIVLQLISPGNEIIAEIQKCALSSVSHTFFVDEPRLWHPKPYGAAPLYTLRAILDGHTKNQLFGIRTVEWVQHKLIDAPGKSFFVKVNDIPIFAGGANWIPADSFLATVSPDRLRRWLKLASEGNQNMLRVWGGGCYESDLFYDICDELGIMVWQDFMFACGQYPGDKDFQKIVSDEAVHNIKRLRHHPCLVLFSGGNEDYQIAESEHLQWDKDDTQGPWEDTNFPARTLYEKTLPQAVALHAPWIPYWTQSPYGGTSTRDPTEGDIHQWEVWHGQQLSYQAYGKLSGRFVSEFGMEAFPAMATIESWMGKNASRTYPFDQIMDYHNKAAGGSRRLMSYLVENFRFKMLLEDMIYKTQLLQAEAVGNAVRLWRRNWKGPNKEYTAGALVWQLNDCWPTTSWSIVDYFSRPKAAYYALKRELSPVTVASSRKASSSGQPKHQEITEIWACNSSLDPIRVSLRLAAYDLGRQGKEIEMHYQRPMAEYVLAANRSTELTSVVLGEYYRATDRCSLVLAMWITSVASGCILARFVDWPQPFKDFDLPKPEVKLSLIHEGALSFVRAEATRAPAKAVHISASGTEPFLQDNDFDLVPGDPITVQIDGLGNGILQCIDLSA